MKQCKVVQDLVDEFDCLDYVLQENSLFCNVCVSYPRQGANIPGRFLLTDNSDGSTKDETQHQSRNFRNLKSHVKRHFEGDLHDTNMKEKTEFEQHLLQSLSQESML